MRKPEQVQMGADAPLQPETVTRFAGGEMGMAEKKQVEGKGG
jgi:hypothetical protein